MTDDAELRARIEAQVAARRAGAASPGSAGADEQEDRSDGSVPGASRGLAPIRLRHARSGAGSPVRPTNRVGAGHGPGAGADATPERVVTEPTEVERRLAAERAEAEQLAAARADRAELARLLAAERAEQLAAERAEVDRRLAAERVEGERLAGEPVEAAQLAADRAELDRLMAERAELQRRLTDQLTEGRRARRALRWLLARAPEPAEAAGRPESAASPTPPASASTPADHEDPADGWSPTTTTTAVGAGPTVDTGTIGERADEPSQQPARLRRFGRRRHVAGPEDDEPHDQFDLPAPDAAFEQPWLRGATMPPPTREWTGPQTSGAAQAEAVPADAAPEPAPSDADAVDAAPDRHRPSPGPDPAPRRRPGPRPSGAPGPHPRPTPAPVPSHRPAPGPTSGGFGPTAYSDRAAGPNYQPDTARFIPAAESGDDEDGDEGTGSKGLRGRRAWCNTIRTLVMVVIAAMSALLLRIFVVQPYYIPSESMEPTLHGCSGCNDDHVLVDKISYRAHDVRVRDIVVFDRPPGDAAPEKVLIKRVVALGGDTVQLKSGQVYVNGLPLDEPYIAKQCGRTPTRPLTSTARWKVPADDVFVMGDNRCHSDDSRAFGPIPTSSIVGRAFAIIWPLNRARMLSS